MHNQRVGRPPCFPADLLRHIAWFTLALCLLASVRPLNQAIASDQSAGEGPWDTWPLSGATAIQLHGESGLDPDLHYVSFSGDFGFRDGHALPVGLDEFSAWEQRVLAPVALKIANLEFLPDGSSKASQLALQLLADHGFDAVSMANNHALDDGPARLAEAASMLDAAGLVAFGTIDNPHITTMSEGASIAIVSATNYTDEADPIPDDSAGVIALDDDGVRRIGDIAAAHDFTIAFLHLGSLSRFPSPHETERVEAVIEAGADLVVCTGSHFVKGVRLLDEVPVLFGIGNHLFSWRGNNTEQESMHVVVGFRGPTVEQIFAIPYLNDWQNGSLGPLAPEQFDTFIGELALRSDPDGGDYFTDDRTATLFWEQVSKLSIDRLGKIRPRHVTYAIRILYGRHPIPAWTLTFTFALVVAWLIARRRLIGTKANQSTAGSLPRDEQES